MYINSAISSTSRRRCRSRLIGFYCLSIVDAIRADPLEKQLKCLKKNPFTKMRHSVKSSFISKQPFSCELELGINKDLRLSWCALKPEIFLLWLALGLWPCQRAVWTPEGPFFCVSYCPAPHHQRSQRRVCAVSWPEGSTFACFFPCACVSGESGW